MAVQQEDKKKDEELKPLSKEEALASIRKFKNDFGLAGINTSKERVRTILKKSGLLSDEIDKMRREKDA